MSGLTVRPDPSRSSETVMAVQHVGASMPSTTLTPGLVRQVLWKSIIDKI